MSRRRSSPETAPAHTAAETVVRLDKWLWAARFFKTRSLAVEAVERGRISVNGQAAKPAREVRVGDRIALRQPEQPEPRCVVVRGLSAVRGPAPVAQQLYEETAESVAARLDWQARRPYVLDPAAALEQGRPTKQDRRRLEALGRPAWQRWSASIDDE